MTLVCRAAHVRRGRPSVGITKRAVVPVRVGGEKYGGSQA